MWSYRRGLKKYFSKQKTDLLYARSPSVLGALISTGIPVIIELHALPRYGKQKFSKLCNQCKRVVCLTSLMRDELVSWGVNPKKIIVEGDAVDYARFQKSPSPKKSKQHWDLPLDRPIVGYVGSFVTFDNVQKGVNILIDTLASLKKRQVPVYGWIVGGPPSWLYKYRRYASSKGLTDQDIHFEDTVPSSQVPMALEACDICVYPAPDSKHPFFQRDTSPLKLFEYLASETPVVCADIPPVRDVVDDQIVRLVHPGSVPSLAGGIIDVLEHSGKARERAARGKAIVEEHSWEKRMKRILGMPIEYRLTLKA